MKQLVVVLGTRPEAIKLAPVIAALRQSEDFEVQVVSTGQHRDLVRPILSMFDIEADINLDIMQEGQNLFDISIKILEMMESILTEHDPDGLMVQGDTSSALSAAQAAFYMKIPVIHVEAGLRSYDRYDPFPEEINRRLISQLSNVHLAPTENNRAALIRENVQPGSIFVTGNPVIDALKHITQQLETSGSSPAILDQIDTENRLIVLTSHRRENFGTPHQQIFRAVNQLLQSHDDIEVVYPLHPNPNVQEAAEQWLEPHKRLHLIEPLDYLEFLQLMNAAFLIMTDSGGIQEEAPALGKPVLVLRKTTERTEIIEAGNARLSGIETERIVQDANAVLEDKDLYQSMTKTNQVYGDGNAAANIITALNKWYANS